MRVSLCGALLFVALAVSPAAALDGPILGVGDRVPDLDIAHFFQGKEVTAFDKEKIYVLEFWATW